MMSDREKREMARALNILLALVNKIDQEYDAISPEEREAERDRNPYQRDRVVDFPGGLERRGGRTEP